MPDDPLIHDPDGGMPRLLEIMRRLRDPDTGCPWDIEQDFASIAPYSAKTRSTRHCCSVIPVSLSISRIGAITLSRARNNAIGNDRSVEGNLLVIRI